MRPRPPQSATSRHYAEPIQANGGDYDDLDGDYDLAGRDSTDRDEGYVHRVRPRPASLGSRRTSDMSISVQGPPAPQRVPAPPYAVSIRLAETSPAAGPSEKGRGGARRSPARGLL